MTLTKRNTRHISKRTNLKIKSQQMAVQWWRNKILTEVIKINNQKTKQKW